MIAVDTASLVAFFEGESGRDIDLIDAALHASALFLPPPVLSELLSDPALTDESIKIIMGFPLLLITEGFWGRAGLLRAKVLAKGRKARLADAFIAQISIDHDLPLVTRDTDFHGFQLVSKLKLAR